MPPVGRPTATAASLAAPVVAGLIGLAVVLAIAGDVPDRVALMLASGGPGGYTGRGTATALVALGPLAGLVVGGTLLALRRRRLAAGLGTAVAVFGTWVVAAVHWGHRGLPDPRGAPAVTEVVVLALLAAALVGALVAAAARDR
jgi:hypothetical protein